MMSILTKTGTNVDSFKYKDLVKECFGRVNNYSLRERLKKLANNFKGEVFLNHKHKEIFYTFFQKQDVDIYDISSRFIAKMMI